jgi:hypothetical protein
MKKYVIIVLFLALIMIASGSVDKDDNNRIHKNKTYSTTYKDLKIKH